MLTQKLYERDAYLRSFTACVLSCTPEENDGGWAVVLDQTAFYPEGGGQPGDIGVLGAAAVADTRIRDGEIVHLCDAPLTPGSTVTGSIDWERRFDLMQQHSGEHIVSGILCGRFGCDNVGFHLGADTVVIDFNCTLTAQQLSEVERTANEAIWSNLPFLVSYPTPEELAVLEYRSKKALTGQVRIVECPGMDRCACCGTHVRAAGELGLIKLISLRPLRGGVRIEMLAGKRAYEYVCGAVEQNGRISALLSAKVNETAEAAARLQEALAAANYRITGLENAAFARQAETLRDAGNVLLFEGGLTADGVRRLCDAVAAECGGRCAVFSGTDAGGYKYAIARIGGNLRAMTARLNAALSGRGGGKPGFVQGSVAADRARIEAFFAADPGEE